VGGTGGGPARRGCQGRSGRVWPRHARLGTCGPAWGIQMPRRPGCHAVACARTGAPGAGLRRDVGRFKFVWPCLTASISKYLNRSAPKGEKQSCRSLNPLQLLQRSSYVFLNCLSRNIEQSWGLSWRQRIVFLAVDQVFHPFTLKIWNATQKLSCVPRKTGQLLYWEILKCLGEIWRTRQKFRRALKGKGV
jgi:hypothetical protein